MTKLFVRTALIGALALLSACINENKFMASAGKAGDVRWAALVTEVDGIKCGHTFQHVTIRIRDNMLTLYPYYGYQRVLYTADLKTLNADGSGRVVATKDTDQEAEGFGDNAHFTFDPGAGPRHIKVTSRYEDYCKYSIDPVDPPPAK